MVNLPNLKTENLKTENQQSPFFLKKRTGKHPESLLIFLLLFAPFNPDDPSFANFIKDDGTSPQLSHIQQ